MLSGTPILTDDLRWDVSVNFATLEKIVDFIYPGIEKEIFLTDGYHGQVWTFKKSLVKNGVCYMEEKENKMLMETGFIYQVEVTHTTITSC